VTSLARAPRGLLYAGTAWDRADRAKSGAIEKTLTGTSYVPLMTAASPARQHRDGGHTISRLLATGAGECFVGTNRGLTRTVKFESFKQYSGDSKEPAKLKDGSLGYEDRKGNCPLLSNFIRALERLPDGRIAVGVKTGISILDPRTDAWTTVQKGDEASPAARSARSGRRPRLPRRHGDGPLPLPSG
jgi:hypothetical protein